MSDEHAIYKVAGVWIATVVGSITLSQVVLVLTAAYTVLQIWRLLREYRKERRREKFRNRKDE